MTVKKSSPQRKGFTAAPPAPDASGRTEPPDIAAAEQRFIEGAAVQTSVHKSATTMPPWDAAENVGGARIQAFPLRLKRRERVMLDYIVEHLYDGARQRHAVVMNILSPGLEKLAKEVWEKERAKGKRTAPVSQ